VPANGTNEVIRERSYNQGSTTKQDRQKQCKKVTVSHSSHNAYTINKINYIAACKPLRQHQQNVTYGQRIVFRRYNSDVWSYCGISQITSEYDQYTTDTDCTCILTCTVWLVSLWTFTPVSIWKSGQSEQSLMTLVGRVMWQRVKNASVYHRMNDSRL